MIHDSILDTIGDTPIIKLHRLAPKHVDLYVKVEAFNPAGSVKDRPALSMRAVALAALALLAFEPEDLVDPGFQMSFAAVIGLIALAEFAATAGAASQSARINPQRRCRTLDLPLLESLYIGRHPKAPPCRSAACRPT